MKLNIHPSYLKCKLYFQVPVNKTMTYNSRWQNLTPYFKCFVHNMGQVQSDTAVDYLLDIS